MNSHKENEGLNWARLLRGNEIAYAHDLSGNMTFLNPVGERISGYTCEEGSQMLNTPDQLASRVQWWHNAEKWRSVAVARSRSAGHFALGHGARCHPLTLLDDHSQGEREKPVGIEIRAALQYLPE